MGKVKRLREKYHLSAQKPAEKLPSAVVQSSQINPWAGSVTAAPPQHACAVKSEVFAGVNIKVENLNKQLQEFDTQSRALATFSKSSLELPRGLDDGGQLKKKDKRKRRREAFINKIAAITKAKTENEKRKFRQCRPIIGDLEMLTSALPVVEDASEMPSSYSRMNSCGGSSKPNQRHKPRQKQLLQDVKAFHAVLKDPDFEADALGAIREHLQNKIKAGAI